MQKSYTTETVHDSLVKMFFLSHFYRTIEEATIVGRK